MYAADQNQSMYAYELVVNTSTTENYKDNPIFFNGEYLNDISQKNSLEYDFNPNYEEYIDEYFEEDDDLLDLDDLLEGIVNVLTIEKRKNFISKCEVFYKMSTEEFLKEYKRNDYEGNVDFKLWASYAEFLEGEYL